MLITPREIVFNHSCVSVGVYLRTSVNVPVPDRLDQLLHACILHMVAKYVYVAVLPCIENCRCDFHTRNETTMRPCSRIVTLALTFPL